ncbi:MULTISPECIES: MFS transporter [Marinobacter]|jgi:AAHS family benzoate transporter-like MFS transporter|uniref:MFS transporter, AAHS family, benzoate transport protein n=1 Tax=Marinobacter salarius TaxID=1420917 RepID=A0ABY1FKX9_9GAMM|nr:MULTISPECIES: MFS transporter [Marinobacter]KXJ46680.1 MAG: MFS transporter [Marinobacter sp. Hex_13]MBJ7298957.1 MFS transporter [Marinobacter salarius]MCC4284003.1 MFS transporter [Marinobacter salarius]OLF83992.1 MFS transporter [Marinobacter sp. C18]SFL52032.1 MFS transporter, AAHS family, benzoate transport protein [Marinobacter salarius]|tara:strand:- start:1288 stop:2640 length:1353 start_codon:yes stop_codon:yes gene_type:complete
MRNIDVNDVIDNATFNKFHWKVLFWCTLIIVFDGYDLVIYGVVLPILMDQWDLNPYVAGLLGSSALFGMMFGAMGFGMLSDRLGRKKVIITCVVLFSVTTVINGFATTPWQFGILRFIAGLGIGGVMPNVVSLMSEYSPKKSRSTLVALMFSGYAVGGMMSAGLGIWIVPNYGWEIMFYLAVVPMLMLPFMLKFLPESVAFLMAQKREGEARDILTQVAPLKHINEQDVLTVPPTTDSKAPVLELFRDGRAMSTMMFWVAFFCCLLMVYALGSWLPKLMSNAGYALSSSLMFLMVLNVGAIIGAVGGGWLADRLSLRSVLVSFFILGSGSLVLLGYESPMWFLYILVGIAGATTIGSQILLYAYVAQYYPTSIRSTGLGWASGIGRNGAIVGPLLGGALLAMALPHQMNFLALAVPGAIATVAIALVGSRGFGFRREPVAPSDGMAVSGS